MNGVQPKEFWAWAGKKANSSKDLRDVKWDALLSISERWKYNSISSALKLFLNLPWRFPLGEGRVSIKVGVVILFIAGTIPPHVWTCCSYPRFAFYLADPLPCWKFMEKAMRPTTSYWDPPSEPMNWFPCRHLQLGLYFLDPLQGPRSSQRTNL